MEIGTTIFKTDRNTASGKMSMRGFPHSMHLSNKYTRQPSNLKIQDISFEGFLFKPVLDTKTKLIREFNAAELLKVADEHLGSGARELFDKIKKSPYAGNLISAEDESKVTFNRKHPLRLIYDGIIYPFTAMPCDIVSGMLTGIRKIKPLERWADNLYKSPFLENMRQRSKIDSEVASVRGLFQMIQDTSEETLSDKLFHKSVKMFDLKTGNYDTKHERSLNRIVSGAIPAIFLANDAHNLAIMSSNKQDKSLQAKDAQKEAKTRFKQEVSRVGLTAYLQLITFGALQKYINNSAAMVMLNTAATVLFTESISRIANGKHITKLTPEQAKAINDKNNPANKDLAVTETKDKLNEHSKNINSSALTDLGQKNKAFSAITGFKGDEKTAEQKKQEPLLSFNTLMKASAVIIAAGLSIKGLRKITSFDNYFKSVTRYFDNIYKNLTTIKDYTIEEAEFKEIVKKLDDYGFEKLAAKYQNIADKFTVDGNVHLGEKDKWCKPFVNFMLSPFKSIYRAIRFPYTIVNKIIELPKTLMKSKETQELIINDKVLRADLLKSIDKMKIMSKKKMNPEEFKEFERFVKNNILKSFNDESVSNISNSELANLAKTSATAATLWFLMADNYNMVMLKSGGEDKKGAEERFKARFVQEMSRLFYQTALIDLFNTTFVNPYHASLLGMSWVTAANTLISEILNRKSIGMPVMRHSKDEIIEIEKKKENATGALKNYYGFMSKLTGKKTLAEQQKHKT